MGRRKQANPTKVGDEYNAGASTSETSGQPSTDEPADEKAATDKKSTIDFSISSHLQTDNKTGTKVRKLNNSGDSSTNNISYETAQKAYKTLMQNLKQQESLMNSMGFGTNSAAAFFMNPFFAANMQSSYDFFSGLQNLAQKRKHNKLEDDSAVDLSTKKKRASEGKSSKQNGSSSNSALDKLSSLVTNVGSSPSSMNLMKMQNAIFGSTDANSDPTRVFTCLQCLDRFQSMQELVEHMEKTLHFNQLKAFANPSTGKTKSMTNSPATKSPSPSDKGRASSRGGTYNFECLICGYTSSGSIDDHMKSTHNFKTPNDYILAVKLIPL